MNTHLEQNESLVKEGLVTFSKSIPQGIGGRLFLTNRRMIFEPSTLEKSECVEIIELSEVQATTPCWSKLFRFIPIYPNAISIVTKGGRTFSFLVFGHK